MHVESTPKKKKEKRSTTWQRSAYFLIWSSSTFTLLYNNNSNNIIGELKQHIYIYIYKELSIQSHLLLFSSSFLSSRTWERCRFLFCCCWRSFFFPPLFFNRCFQLSPAWQYCSSFRKKKTRRSSFFWTEKKKERKQDRENTKQFLMSSAITGERKTQREKKKVTVGHWSEQRDKIKKKIDSTHILSVWKGKMIFALCARLCVALPCFFFACRPPLHFFFSHLLLKVRMSLRHEE